MEKIFKKAELFPEILCILDEYGYDCVDWRSVGDDGIAFAIASDGLGGFISATVLRELMSVGVLVNIMGSDDYLELLFSVNG